MATISELNVRLGLLYQDFDKSLGAVEKRLERSGRKFSQLGNDLVLSITAPLVALGAAAIQQAGEIESLKLAMTSTFEAGGRSAAEAAKELEALRQAAKAPGLDFEQAVKGSIRLQGVGFSAEEARRVLSELANTISLTGGTAHELDAVTRQFAQMIAKGRVLQEDVTIIAENMPRISNLMQQAFGTASVEAIRNSGVSAKEFVARITEAAAVLPRVEGGIKNALVNAGAEARNSMAKLGEAIAKALDVPGLLKRFADGLAGAVKWFESLSDGAQKNIVQLGALAIAAGPVVKVYGALAGGVSQLIGLFGSFASATKPLALFFGGMTESTKSVSGYVKEFSKTMLGAGEAAMKMRVGILAATGGVAAIVLGIAAAVALLSDNFNASEFASEQFARAQESVTKEAAKEVGQLNKNINVLRDVRSTTDERKAAIDDLLKTYPGYLKGVDLEKESLIRLNEIQQTLTANIIRGIAERKKADAINAIYEKQAEILLRIQEIQRTGKASASEATLIDTGDMLKAGSIASAVILKLKDQVKSLGEQANVTAADFDKAFGIESRALNPLLESEYRARGAAEDARDAFLGFNDAVKKSSESASGASGAAAEKAKKMASAYKSVLASIDAVNKKQEELGFDFLPEKTKEIENGVERLLEAGFGPNSKPIQKLKQYLADIRAEISRGFATPNAAQKSVGASTAAPAALPTLATATSVQSISIETSGADAAIGRMEDFVKSLGLAQAAFVKLGLTGMKTGDELAAVWGRLQTGAITFGDALTQSAQLFQERYGQIAQDMLGKIGEIASGIVAIQANRAEQEKAILDEEYASRIAAAEGNVARQKELQDELAAKKKEIDKKVAKSQQTVAIVQAVINTALGVTQALSSAPPPYNFILAALTAAAGAVQIATIKSQKFAEGGVVTKPTLGLVGEYPGAATNPEIISPERKMRAVFRDEMSGGPGGPTELFSVIRGDDLYLVMDKAAQRRSRKT